MGSYLVIEITGPLVDLEKVKLAKLPTFELHDCSGWELDEIMDHTYGQPPTGTGRWHIMLDGNSKWSADTANWVHRFTAKHPTLQVMIREEWDNRDADEPGVSEDIYRGGDWVEAESRVGGEVPYNLHALLEAARGVLARYDSAAAEPDDDPGYHKRVDAALDCIEPLRTLVKGLS